MRGQIACQSISRFHTARPFSHHAPLARNMPAAYEHSSVRTAATANQRVTLSIKCPFSLRQISESLMLLAKQNPVPVVSHFLT
jgi:hypothetical protein